MDASLPVVADELPPNSGGETHLRDPFEVDEALVARTAREAIRDLSAVLGPLLPRRIVRALRRSRDRG